MPPLVQSANWISLARQAGKLLARASTRPMKKVKPLKTSTVPHQAKQLLRHTFPSLFTPAHLLELQLNPAYLHRNITSSTFNRAAQLSRAGNPLVQAARGFRTAARGTKRPTVPAPVNVGLGTARGYAAGTGAGGSQMMSAKVPMMMRALASLLDSELELNSTLPYPSKYTPYDVQRISNIAAAIATSKLTFESVDEIRRTFQEYFTQLPQPTTTTVVGTASGSGSTSTSHLLEPSQLVTPGVYTTLTIPLAPSYHSILELPRQEPYAGSDLGVRKFANLLKGILTINQIVHNRASHFIIPLMDKLDSLGITFDPDASMSHAHIHAHAHGSSSASTSKPRCEQWVSYVDVDDYQLPESISIKFHDRSSDDVRRILGESLRSAQEGDWWALTETRLDTDLTTDETFAMQDGWDDDHAHRGQLELDTSQLVMPLIDLDEPFSVYDASVSYDHGYQGDWTDIASDTSASTPSTLDDESQSPDSDMDLYLPGSDLSSARSASFASTLSEHLDAISQLSSADGRGRDGDRSLISMSDDLSDPAQHEWQVLSDSE